MQDIIRGKTPSSWSLVVYGKPGVGKSYWASLAPRPFFLDLENGLKRIDCDRTPVITTYEDLEERLRFVYASKDYDTLAIDTLDALETILTNKILRGNKDGTLADFGYGKGYEALEAEWGKLFVILAKIQAVGKNIILVGHDQIQTFANPLGDNFDRYVIKLHKKSAALVTAKVDAVLYAHFEVILRGKGQEKKKAVGSGDRFLSTVDSPACVAKNRFNLAPVEPMNETLFTKLGG